MVAADLLELLIADAPLLRVQIMASSPMCGYKPGQSIRSSVTAESLGLFTDAGGTLTLTVLFPDGSSSSPAVVHDSTGLYHADFVVPAAMTPGIAVETWQAAGTLAVQNATSERRFRVEALGSPST